MSEKSKCSSALHLSVRSPNETSRPIEAGEASATTSETGKRRSARIASISRPTLPVAPATATLKPDMMRIPFGSWPPAWLPMEADLRPAPAGEDSGRRVQPFVPPVLAGRMVVVVFERRCGIETVPASGAKAADAGFEKPWRGRIVNAVRRRAFPQASRQGEPIGFRGATFVEHRSLTRPERADESLQFGSAKIFLPHFQNRDSLGRGILEYSKIGLVYSHRPDVIRKQIGKNLKWRRLCAREGRSDASPAVPLLRARVSIG